MDGLIGAYGLKEWWQDSLDAEERARLDDVFRPIGADPRPLTQGCFDGATGHLATATGLLISLVGWLRAIESDRAISRKIRGKIVELVESESDPLVRHFTYGTLIELFYRDRNVDSTALLEAVRYCELQIAMSEEAAIALGTSRLCKGLPAHTGYRQLAIIREKMGDYSEAINLAKMADSQGWFGDWNERIDRCEDRVKKRNLPRVESGS